MPARLAGRLHACKPPRMVGVPWFRLALGAIFASVAIAIVYVGVAKFDLNDPATNDVHQYIALYRGHSIDRIVKPFRYRLVVPELARLIPNPPATLLHGSDITSNKIVKLKFGVVNAAFLFVGAWSLLLLLTTLGFSEDEA